MQSIITLFQRNADGSLRDEVSPGAEWVAAGEGTATRMWDGLACMVRSGQLYKQANPGQPGWVPVGNGPEDQGHREAFEHFDPIGWDPRVDGTYELLGPTINGNPERLGRHLLMPHAKQSVDAPRDFAGLRRFLAGNDFEGVVWVHPDGRMVKLQAADFGMLRVVE
jgi:hypothetical protein